jgi:hypothetical protein
MGWLKKLGGSLAMVAAPFVAPQISSFLGLSGLIGATAGSALTGAALGGAGAALAGQSPGFGALYGGAGGGLAGYFSAPSAPSAPSTPAAPAGGTGIGNINPPAAAPPAAPAVPPVALPPSGTGGDLTMLERMRRGVMSGPFWQGTAQMALAGLNAPPEGLTGAEQRAAADSMRVAASRQALMDQKRDLFNQQLQSTGFSPERAFAQAQMSTQRATNDVNRGRPQEQRAANQRRAALSGTLAGTAAVGQGAEQAQRARAGLISQFPTDVPMGGDGATLPLYQNAERRQDAYNESIGRAAGLMFGGLAGGDMYRPAVYRDNP